MKKRILIGGVTVVLILVSIYVFSLRFSVPSEFLTDEEIIKEIKKVYEYFDISEVQDVILIDERNVFVPLLFENDNFGMATWTWNPTKKWQLQSFDLIGSPKIWNVGDETEHYFIWNMPPDENVAGVNFYLIRNRDAWISGYKPVYLPRIQLEQHVSFEGKGYGVLKMPNDWVELTEQLSKDEAGRTEQLFQSMFSQNELVHFGWRTVDHKGQLKYIESSGTYGGFSFSQSANFEQLILPLHEGEVEFGK